MWIVEWLPAHSQNPADGILVYRATSADDAMEQANAALARLRESGGPGYVQIRYTVGFTGTEAS